MMSYVFISGHTCFITSDYFLSDRTVMFSIGLYRENAIATENEARYPNGGNVYYVTMQMTFHIPEFALKERSIVS